MKCEECLPWEHPAIVRQGESFLPCLLPVGHDGEHLIRNSDDLYFLWWEVVCEDCTSEDYCDCFDYECISEEAAEKLLNPPEPPDPNQYLLPFMLTF